MAGVSDVIGSVLIANRGEIAVRIVRSCRDLGIRPIAVYSDADRDSLAVHLADRAFRLGPSPAALSYLAGDRIVEIAREAGADAVHPGYGFLAEDPSFAEMVRGAGLVFVGPATDCIARMGSKREAKRIAADAGVPVLPGYSGDDQALDRLEAEGRAIGFPLMVKASGGGGGRGMRVVNEPGQLGAALAAARREALAAFRDGTLLLERLVESARHIEVQVAGDRSGDIIHLFERDCSIQRRNQKLIEEAPAASLDPAGRTGLWAAAVAVTRAVGFDSVGTVEFLVDARSGEFWFLEMNTRLQVEHPVTEMITGVDLVGLQLRLAAGMTLGIAQADVRASGVAIEARVSAEDPAADCRPEVGVIRLYRPPAGAGIRVESGIETGSEVTPFYDGLLAKVIAWGPDRATARDRLAAALDQWTSGGVVTTAPWLARVIRHPGFLGSPLTTEYLVRHGFDHSERVALDPGQVAMLAALLVSGKERPDSGPWDALGGWRLGGDSDWPGTPFSCQPTGGQLVRVRVAGRAGKYRVLIGADGETKQIVSVDHRGPNEAVIGIDGRTVTVPFAIENDTVHAHLGTRDVSAWFGPPAAIHRAGATDNGPDARVVAPLPGVVASVSASVGQAVARGDAVLVLEAMKLVHTLVVESAGVVRAVHCSPGMTVAGGEVLIELEPADPVRS